MSTPRFSSAKDQQIVVVCDSVSIAAGNISGVLSSLKSLSGDRASAMGAEGAVTLVFNGYDDDPRELHSIPEVRETIPIVHKRLKRFSESLTKRDASEVGVRYERYALSRPRFESAPQFAKPKVVIPTIVNTRCDGYAFVATAVVIDNGSAALASCGGSTAIPSPP